MSKMKLVFDGPVRAFHASRHDGNIRDFALLTHFGTLEAALQRAQSQVFSDIEDAMMYEVDLVIRNPLEMRDLKETNHSWLKISDSLHYMYKVLSGNERGRIFDAAAPAGSNTDAGNAELCGILLAKGYDGIAYVNQHENPGSISWIIIDPTTVKTVSVRPLSEWTGTAAPRP